MDIGLKDAAAEGHGRQNGRCRQAGFWYFENDAAIRSGYRGRCGSTRTSFGADADADVGWSLPWWRFVLCLTAEQPPPQLDRHIHRAAVTSPQRLRIATSRCHQSRCAISTSSTALRRGFARRVGALCSLPSDAGPSHQPRPGDPAPPARWL